MLRPYTRGNQPCADSLSWWCAYVDFTTAIAATDDTLVIGAYRDDHVALNAGSAYVLRRNGSAWSQEAKLTANAAAANDLFGVSVAISGETVVVGSLV